MIRTNKSYALSFKRNGIIDRAIRKLLCVKPATEPDKSEQLGRFAVSQAFLGFPSKLIEFPPIGPIILQESDPHFSTETHQIQQMKLKKRL